MKTISVKISEEEYKLVKNMAEKSGKSISMFCREKIFSREGTDEKLAELDNRVSALRQEFITQMGGFIDQLQASLTRLYFSSKRCEILIEQLSRRSMTEENYAKYLSNVEGWMKRLMAEEKK